jgi:hypothetical protein
LILFYLTDLLTQNGPPSYWGRLLLPQQMGGPRCTLSTCGDSSLSKISTFATLVKACSLSPHEFYRPHSHALELGEGWVTGSLHKSRQFLSACGGNCGFLSSWECDTPPALDLPFTFMSMLHAMSGRFHIEGPTVGQLIELHGHWRTTALSTGRHAPSPHKSLQALRLLLHPCVRANMSWESYRGQCSYGDFHSISLCPHKLNNRFMHVQFFWFGSHYYITFAVAIWKPLRSSC